MWVYFLGLYSVSLIYVPVFYARTILFWWPYKCVLGRVSPPTLFFLKIPVTIWGLLWLHINFWNIWSSFMKYVIGILIGIMLIYRSLWVAWTFKWCYLFLSMNTLCVYTYLYLLQFISLVSYDFPSADLWHPWLGLFLGILLFLKQLWMGLFS